MGKTCWWDCHGARRGGSHLRVFSGHAPGSIIVMDLSIILMVTRGPEEAPQHATGW